MELLIVVATIGTLAAIALPHLLRARMSADEASAIGSLRAINSAEATYASSCGRSGFAQSLDDLAKPPAGSNNGFVSPDLSTNDVLKSGYHVNLTSTPDAVTVATASEACNAAAADAVSEYFAEAHPAVVGLTGQRSFGTDKRGTLYSKPDGTAMAPGMAGGTVLR
jgi:type IV pilus assembly protein PilA